MSTENSIGKAYAAASEKYAALGVDTEKVLKDMDKVSLSLHCWQADDVTGFENRGGSLTGGIQVTGNYPGRARNMDEVRAVLTMVVQAALAMTNRAREIPAHRKTVFIVRSFPCGFVGFRCHNGTIKARAAQGPAAK